MRLPKHRIATLINFSVETPVHDPHLTNIGKQNINSTKAKMFTHFLELVQLASSTKFSSCPLQPS